MHLVYIDEIKHEPGVQPYYWLCGLAIPEQEIATVEAELSQIAHGYFGTAALQRDTEFHAQHIAQGKGEFKGKPDANIELFVAVARVISGHPEIGRIVVRLDTDRIGRNDIQQLAFMYFVERVDVWLANRSKGLLIVDSDAQFIESNVANLATYRSEGTDFEYGRTIQNLVDTVHHTHSHHSRLLQLADVFAYSNLLNSKKELKYPRLQIVERLRRLDPFFFPSTYKHWPPNRS